MKTTSFHRAFSWPEKAWFVAFVALAFLPFLGALRFYRDDWYYILDGAYGGASIFHTMFSIDRPLRGYVFEWLYSAFGQNPLPYHLTVLAGRILAGLSALWLFRLLWPQARRATWWMAALFALYPGYLWWPAGVEYAPMMISLALQVFSFACSLAAWKAPARRQQMALGLAAIASGWAYLGLVDYAIGMELLRLACFFLLAGQQGLGAQAAFRAALRAWAPYAVIPAGFLFWHSFLFENLRPDTDLGQQVGKLFQSPVNVGLWWLVRWVQSAFNGAFLAWGEPLRMSWQGLRLREILISLGCGLLGTGLLWIVQSRPGRSTPAESNPAWARQALIVGCMGLYGGIWPVVIANRSIQFENFSHYALPLSIAAALIAGGVIGLLRNVYIRQLAILGLIGLAFATHAARAQQVLAEEREIGEFWWQMSWRAPDMQPGTTFVVNYPTVRYGEDWDVAWGPANHLYAGGQIENGQVHYRLSALPQSRQAILEALSGQDRPWTYRSHGAKIHARQLVVASQPAAGSCVHVFDGSLPWFSTQESEQIILLAPASRQDMILTEGQAHVPAALAFGPEPEHGWCFYFQKASLAFQRQDWDAVTSLAQEALQKGFRPVDRSEWFPFLMAYAITDRPQAIAETATRINDSPYLQQQACKLLQNLAQQGFSLSREVQTQIDELFCP
ncbi:MAG: hypothetical protein ACOYYS_10295 [Chloroflexota bacterium]